MGIIKKIILTAILIIIGEGISSAVSISGKVIDSKINKPVSGMVAGIEELRLISETDRDGNFSFNNIPPGKYTLYFSHSDYGTEKVRVRAKRDFYIEKRIGRKVYDTGDIPVSYGRISNSIPEESITRDDIKKYPMRGFGDTLHLLQTLPGVGGGFSLAVVPIIRGTNPLYNKYYIDDIPVDYPFHYLAAFLPLFSGLNEESVDEVELVKGNAPVWTGDHLGTLINIRTRRADQDGVHGRLILDPVIPFIPTFAFTAVPHRDLSIAGSVRRSDIDWFVDTEKSDFSFQDYFIRVEYNLFRNHRLTLLAHGSEDEMDYRDYKARSGYTVSGLKWEYLINKYFFLKTVLSRYEMEQYLKNDRVYTDRVGASIRIYPRQDRLFQILSFTVKNFYLKAGYEYIKHTKGCETNIAYYDLANLDFFKQTSTDMTLFYPVRGNTRSLFMQTGFTGRRGWINLGVKSEKYGPIDNRSYPYSADAGIYLSRGRSIYLKQSVNYAHPDIYYHINRTDPDFKDAKATNRGMGINQRFTGNLFLNGEIYYSRYENLNPGITFNVDDEFYKKFAQLHPFSEEREGRTYGGELSVKWTRDSFSGRTAYSYSVSKRKNESLDDFYSDFDQTHLFRFLVSWKRKRWIFSSIWHLSSSLPYTPITGSNGSGGNYTAEYGERNSGRFSAHSRLDMKASYYWEEGKRFYLEAWNVLLNTGNTIFEYYDNDKPYGSSNPEKFNDLPIFIWAGFELCI